MFSLSKTACLTCFNLIQHEKYFTISSLFQNNLSSKLLCNSLEHLVVLYFIHTSLIFLLKSEFFHQTILKIQQVPKYINSCRKCNKRIQRQTLLLGCAIPHFLSQNDSASILSGDACPQDYTTLKIIV